MVKFDKPEESYEELKRWQLTLETSFKLNLYTSRCVVALSTGDMGFSKQQNLRLWSVDPKTPTVKSQAVQIQKDFQARRAQIRYRDEADAC